MDFLLKHKKWILMAGIALVLFSVLAFVWINAGTQTAVIWVDDQTQPIKVQTNANTAAAILVQAHIAYAAGDRILINGDSTAPDQIIPDLSAAVIQVLHAHRIDLTIAGAASSFRSSAPTLGRALWENNIILTTSDRVNPPLETPLTRDLQVSIRRGQPVQIQTAGQTITISTAADTVGQALDQAGIALQNLDYSVPDENQPITPNQTIRVVRVREEIQLQSTTIPFSKEKVADASLPIDTQKVVQSGEYGLKTARVRIRYEDGKETSRTSEAEWLAKAPVTQKTAYGTGISTQSVSTADGPFESWRSLAVWITSYHDTGSRTASGKWPEFGDVAVSPAWYKCLKGQRLYIPGYGVGTVVDVCPGCVGKPWIDVFISTAQYVSWHTTETIYFLNPPPANFECSLQ